MRVRLSGAPLAVLAAAARLREAPGFETIAAPSHDCVTLPGYERDLLAQVRALAPQALEPRYLFEVPETHGLWTLRFPREQRPQPADLARLAQRAHSWASDLLLGSRLAWAASAESKARDAAPLPGAHPMAVRSHPDLEAAHSGDGEAAARFRRWCDLQVGDAAEHDAELRHLCVGLDLCLAVVVALHAHPDAAHWESQSPVALARVGGASERTLNSPLWAALSEALEEPDALKALRSCLDYHGAPAFELRVDTGSSGSPPDRTLHFDARSPRVALAQGREAAEALLRAEVA